MKKICLCVVGIFFSLFSVFAQAQKDTGNYISKKLTFEEANIASSYYHQDGHFSAVTGGIGSEKLTDFSNSIEVKLARRDGKNRKHVFGFELGVDHYTSASSDKIDPNPLSSASYNDTRVYPSLTWSMENEAKGTTIGAGLSSSSEYDYHSIGAHISFAQKTRNRNGEFSARLQAYIDKVKIVLPMELRPGSGDVHQLDTKGRNTFSASLSYSQIVNQQLQVQLLLDLAYQSGYLGLPFHRVYFNNSALRIENLPDSRFKLPIGFRANYFLGDKIILRSFYRFYHDDWGLTAHTVELETPVKLTPFLSLSPFYRFYNQTAVRYFAPYQTHKITAPYYTSNYDLSAFNSSFFGSGLRVAPPKGVLGLQHFNALEIRYGHYTRSNGLQSDIISLHLTFK